MKDPRERSEGIYTLHCFWLAFTESMFDWFTLGIKYINICIFDCTAQWYNRMFMTAT